MRIIINLMISYCQCRRQAIPPWKDSAVEAASRSRLGKPLSGAAAIPQCQARGSTRSGGCRPRRVFARSGALQSSADRASEGFSVPDGAQPGGGRAPSQPGAPGGTPGGPGRRGGPGQSLAADGGRPGQRLDNLQRALAELPAICRSSFLLRKLDGLSHSQIAEHLNISRSLVEKHIVNAMKHCRCACANGKPTDFAIRARQRLNFISCPRS